MSSEGRLLFQVWMWSPQALEVPDLQARNTKCRSSSHLFELSLNVFLVIPIRHELMSYDNSFHLCICKCSRRTVGRHAQRTPTALNHCHYLSASDVLRCSQPEIGVEEWLWLLDQENFHRFMAYSLTG